MQYCEECYSIEQGTITKVNEDGEEFEVCMVCESEDDTIRHYDEDAGKDR